MHSNFTETTLKNTQQPYTLLLNGDLTDAKHGSKKWTAQIERVKFLIKTVEANPKGKIILIAGDRDWNRSRKGGQKQFGKLEKELKSYIKENKYKRTEWTNKKGFYAHFDGYCLTWNNDMTKFEWIRLPNLPVPLSNFCIASDSSSSIYVYCGGSHHPNPEKNTGKLDVLLEDGEQLGQKIWKLDVATLDEIGFDSIGINKKT